MSFLKSSKRQVKVNKAIYLTKGKEQLDQDSWKRGYLEDSDILFGNAFKIAGLEFKKEKLKAVKDGDSIYTTIELPDEGSSMIISFKKNGNDWDIVNIEQSEIEIKLSSEQLAKQLLSKIERLEAFEENLGVTLENISVIVENSGMTYVHLELHPISGTQITKTINVQCIAYDNRGSIMNTTKDWISPANFFGFENFAFYISDPEKISKLRIFPKT